MSEAKMQTQGIGRSTVTWFQRFCISVLKKGPIPRHVAFIMDGNRRYAKKNNLALMAGHMKGFDKLREMLHWCLEFGTEEITIYAFSIENFKRPKQEVEYLMELMDRALEMVLGQDSDLGMRLRVIGNISLLPERLRRNIARLILRTKDNTGLTVNVALAYTSREEISNAMKVAIEGVRSGEIAAEDIDVDLLDNCLYTAPGPDPDILVRTSGETRLSDFLMWQVTDRTRIFYIKPNWPEVSIWDAMSVIFWYQRNYKGRLEKPPVRSEKVRKFISGVQKQRVAYLESLVKS